MHVLPPLAILNPRSWKILQVWKPQNTDGCTQVNYNTIDACTSLFMPRCACASEVYGSVFVCLSVCVDYFSCSRINEVQVRVSIGF